MKLTILQRQVLVFLLGGHRYPSSIGYMITGGKTRSGRYLRPQGAGRIGGGYASKLQKLGLVCRCLDGHAWMLTSIGFDEARKRSDS